MTDLIENLVTKLVWQNSLGRVIDPIVREFYDSALGKAQEEAFRNAISLDKHPTLTRTVVGKCCEWCDKKQGTYTYPKGEDFARHDNCDCLFITSGYNSRNGVLNNYVKHKNTPARQEQKNILLFLETQETDRSLLRKGLVMNGCSYLIHRSNIKGICGRL